MRRCNYLSVFTVVLGLTVASISDGSASASTHKPVGDLVPRGLNVLTWRYPLVVGGGQITSGTMVVTNVPVVSQVRALINSLPVTLANPKRVCPMYATLPYTVSFSTRVGAPVHTRVVFELGGCPYAQVYQHGVAIVPTLGGAHLVATYQRIQKLISPRGVPLG
jgi:hypothetical protein